MLWGMVMPLLAVLCALAQYQETITVERALIDVRVTEYDGTPVTGLRAEDFEVRVGRERVAVASATWVAEDAEGDQRRDAAGPAGADAGVPRATTPRGRLFILFIQTDFARNRVRIVGQMKFRPYAEQLIDSLREDDRVAVFSFDSHLKFRRDFTADKASIRAAISESLLIDEPPPPPTVPSPSLASRLDRQAMKRAASSEAALLILAKALRGIEGPKTLLLSGWGLGERVGPMVQMTRHWGPARNALEAARVTIFALDTTDASYHDLEIGLAAGAHQTGGSYAKTNEFPSQAIARLRRTLTGHYELELKLPNGMKPGTHRLEVRVKRRATIVLAPTSLITGN